MSSPQHHPALAEEQASLWAARLEGSTLTAADRAALEVWLAAHPAHRTLLSAYCQFSADLEQQLPLLSGIRDELAESPTAAKASWSFPWLRWPTLAGVTLLATAAAVVILWRGQPQNHFQNLATPVAQRQAVSLEDGTTVELNAQTTLAVELGADTRRVRLGSGEAFFHVSKDLTRPFWIETPAGSIRVTGTQFNVHTESGTALDVTVVDGSVQVRTGDAAPRQLSGGERLVREQDRVSVIKLSAGQLSDALAWRQGQIVFDGTPLREALERFGRYHGRSLHAAPAAANQRVGGRYSLDDLDGFLSALETVLPLHVTRGLDGTVQVDAISTP